MKFINNIDLSVVHDVRAREVQETSDILELSMAVLLKKLYDLIDAYNPSGVQIPSKWWETGANDEHTAIATARQNLLNSFDVNVEKAFDDYHTYQGVLAAINPNAATGGLEFPGRFKFTPFQSTTAATQAEARTNSNYHRIINGPHTITEDSGLFSVTTTYTIYETYIRNEDPNIKNLYYYRWKKVVSDANNISSVNGSAFSRTGNLVTVNLTNHGLSNGTLLSIAGTIQSAFKGTYAVSVINTNTFTYTTSTSGNITGTGDAILSYDGISYVDYSYTA
jgi:hypothetical protein